MTVRFAAIPNLCMITKACLYLLPDRGQAALSITPAHKLPLTWQISSAMCCNTPAHTPHRHTCTWPTYDARQLHRQVLIAGHVTAAALLAAERSAWGSAPAEPARKQACLHGPVTIVTSRSEGRSLPLIQNPVCLVHHVHDWVADSATTYQSSAGIQFVPGRNSAIPPWACAHTLCYAVSQHTHTCVHLYTCTRVSAAITP